MKNTFQPEVSRKTNSLRRLAWPVGLVLLGFSVWAACGCLALQRTHHAHNARSKCCWYQRCQVEARQLVSIMNYLLTPEEDVGGISGLVDPRTAVLPALSEPSPTLATGSDNVGAASGATNPP